MARSGVGKRLLAQVGIAAAASTAALAVPTAAHAESVYCHTDYSGYYCLFALGSYGGDQYVEGRCGTYSLSSWFWDKASSWKHRQSAGSYMYPTDWSDFYGRIRLWYMSGQSEANYVQSGYDNRADGVENHCGGV